MTILVRLCEKGQLERQRDGRAYAYHPVKSHEEYAAARMGRLLAIASERSVALNRFLDTIDPADRAPLRRLLKGRRDE
jgi:predicted transcriptional regulator